LEFFATTATAATEPDLQQPLTADLGRRSGRRRRENRECRLDIPARAPIALSHLKKSRSSAVPGMPGSVCPACEGWRLAWTWNELMATSAFNIWSRSAWLGGMAPGFDPSGAAAMSEWQRMWSEKVFAGLDLAVEMQWIGFDLAMGRFDPWSAGARMLRPYHSRTISNSRRLARKRPSGRP
jgi:hypothetical protein